MNFLEILNRLSGENRKAFQQALNYRKAYYKATGRRLGFDPGFLRMLGVI